MEMGKYIILTGYCELPKERTFVGLLHEIGGYINSLNREVQVILNLPQFS